MATIKFSAIVADARGKIGGNVFARNKGGAYVRSFTMPLNPSTGKQEKVRNNLAALSSGWRELTPEQRLGWNESARDFPQTNRIGEQIFLSGQQLYLKFNSTLLNAGADIVTDPPSPTEIPVFAMGIDTLTEASFELDFPGSELIAEHLLIIEATRPTSAGRSNMFRSDFKFVKALAGNLAADTVSITADYEANVSTLEGSTGKKVFLRAYVVVLASGQSGTPFTVNGIVAS